MIVASEDAIPHLLDMTNAEISHLCEIATLEEESWPDEFDPNDRWLYEQILEDLTQAGGHNGWKVDLDRKHAWFLTMIIPAYVFKNKRRLQGQEIASLKRVYDQRPVRWVPFPDD